MLDEYSILLNEFDDYTYFSKITRKFERANRLYIPEDYVLTKPFLSDKYAPNNFYTNQFYIEESIPVPFLLSTKNFFIFPAINNAAYMEESYDFFKNLNYASLTAAKIILNYLTNYFVYNNHIFHCDL
jgi:hypothetical protein